MSRYSDQVRDEYGRPVPGVTVYVYVWDAVAELAGDLDALTDDLSASLANPLTSDADGLFYFNAVDGQKLIEYHFGGKVQFRDLIQVGPVPVPQAVFGGLFVNAHLLSIPVGMDMVSFTGYSILGVGGSTHVYDATVDVAYVAAHPVGSSFVSANSRGFRLDHEQDFTPQMFGAVADGATNDSAAFIAALAYLKALALNNTGGGFYKGSPKLLIPAGNYRSSVAIDVNHTVIVEGEGSGQFGPGSGGCSHIKFDAATDGFRFQAANTSGNIDIDGTVHNGSGGCVIRDLCIEGGYTSTESDHHGLVIRNAIKAERLYIKNFPGEGVKAWAGNVTGQPAVAGNVSTTMLTGVKVEGCRGGIDIRGSEANVITTLNCEAYQNRQFGLIDDNGAGSNTHIGFHAASNGLVTGVWPQTQCSSGGNRYAAVWGGDFTVAPSGTTADTANWYYIEAGAAVTNLIPAHTATANTFRAGGDYLVLNSASAVLLNCYSEYGPFSQFNTTSRVEEGTIGDQYFRGGTRINTGASYGFHVRQTPNAALTFEHDSTSLTIAAMDKAKVQHSLIDFGKTGGNTYKARDVSGHVFQTAPYNGASTTRASVTTGGVNVPTVHTYSVNAVQVVAGRKTGWAVDTGTAKRTANATYTGTAEVGYTQATVQTLMDAVRDLSQTVKALKDDLHGTAGHGLIGT